MFNFLFSLFLSLLYDDDHNKQHRITGQILQYHSREMYMGLCTTISLLRIKVNSRRDYSLQRRGRCPLFFYALQSYHEEERGADGAEQLWVVGGDGVDAAAPGQGVEPRLTDDVQVGADVHGRVLAKRNDVKISQAWVLGMTQPRKCTDLTSRADTSEYRRFTLTMWFLWSTSRGSRLPDVCCNSGSVSWTRDLRSEGSHRTWSENNTHTHTHIAMLSEVFTFTYFYYI